MGSGYALLSKSLQIRTRWDIQRENERKRLAQSVWGDIQHFPHSLLKGKELPAHRPLLRRRVRIFPLGEYRKVWLDSLSGRTTLYIGSDGRLYEYGLACVKATGIDDLICKNPMALRALKIDSLSMNELMLVRDLLRRIWLV